MISGNTGELCIRFPAAELSSVARLLALGDETVAQLIVDKVQGGCAATEAERDRLRNELALARRAHDERVDVLRAEHRRQIAALEARLSRC